MSKEAFTLQYQDVASKAAEQLGVSPTALLAQWGLETGWGKSIIPGTNNLGNIKDFSGKGIEATDSMLKTRDKYRAYKDTSAFADDYVSLIKRRYPTAVGQSTVQGFAQALKDGGYAEDPDYVRKVVASVGEDYTPAGADITTKYDEAISQAVQASVVRPRPRPARDAALDTEAADVRLKEEARPSTFEQFGAAVAGNTDHRILDGFWGPKFAPVEGYTPDLKALPLEADSTLIEDYNGSKSPEEAAHILKRFDDHKARQEAVMDSGVLKGFALSIAAEGTSVTNWVAPFAAAKALARMGSGSLVLAQQGDRVGSVASSIAENLISGTAVEAVAQRAEGRLNGQDLLVSLVADSLLGLGTGLAGIRGVAKAEAALDRAATTALAHEVGLANRATEQLGAGAAPGELRQVMDSLHREDMNQVVTGALADVPTERKLIKEAPMQNDLQASTRFANESNALDEQAISAMDKRYAELRQLGVNLPDSNDAVVRKRAIEDLATEAKTHIGENAKNSLKFAQMAEAIEGLRKQFLPDVAIHLVDGSERLKGSNLGVHAIVKPGVSVLGLRTNSGIATAVHEFGHAVFAHRLAALPADQKKAMEDAWRLWQEKYMTPGKAQEAALQRSPVGAAERRLPSGDESFAGKAAKGEFKQAFADVWDEAFPGNQQAADAYARYYGNFDEYGAEQFAKYVEREVAGLGNGKLTVPQQIVEALSYLLAQAAEIFKFAKAKKLVSPDAPFNKFFNDLLDGNMQKGLAPLELGDMQAMTVPAKRDKTLVVDRLRGSMEEVAKKLLDKGDFTTYPVKGGTVRITNIHEATGENGVAHAFDSKGEVVGELQYTRVEDDGMRFNPSVEVAPARQREGIASALYSHATANGGLIPEVGQAGQARSTEGQAFREGMKQVAPLDAMSVPAKPAEVVNEVMTDPDAAKFGLTIVPVGTAAERKQAQAMLALHKQAAAWEIKNPMDAKWESRVKNLADNNVFNVASTGLVMLKSKSPLVRMLASELVEDASGAAGKRQATAAISKYMQERFMMGNAINDVQGAYAFWKKDKPGGLRDDLVGGNNWAAFHKEVASEIEARRLAKGPVTQDPNIKAAADSLEAAYQRIANAQRAAGTIGNKGLPATSVGYMPHRMSPKAVINMTNEQGRVLHDALVDQFVTIEGWDHSFSDRLASEYMLRVRNRAGGDYGSAIGGNGQGAASQVEEALRGMNLPEVTIAEHMKRFEKGGANFTKGRIELDLNKVYTTSTGDFRLLDIFETNQIELLRSQAGRASGEVALTKFGVQGKPGLKLLRDALAYGEDGKRAGVREKEAFDQMAAEFMNEPFGTNTGKFMERAMAANTLVRLGGIGFNQLAESINGIFHVGAARTMASVGSIPRMRQEIKDLVAGKHVDNPFLTSIEHAGGAEFGTDAYKTVLPFDSPDHAYPTYGQDTLTVTDRLLRGGGYLQAKLSGWKMIHSAQQRGFAEQIVKKLARYVNEGTSDVALRQFGITPDVQAALKKDLHNVTTFDAQGNPLNFDATKITDPAIREQVIQAVWRGTQQIIQGTFIGERGKWAHDGWLKMLTQFRGFGITSMEKQWGRQRNDRGGAAAFGIMVGSMTIAAPIYMARVYASSIGRPDQQAYIDERLTPDGVARATLNYIALSGMVGDFLDLGTALLPEELGVKPTGGRAGVESDFVGNYVLPASSLVNDIWKYTQSPLDAGDAAKILPMSRIPYIVPFVNAVKD